MPMNAVSNARVPTTARLAAIVAPRMSVVSRQGLPAREAALEARNK